MLNRYLLQQGYLSCNLEELDRVKNKVRIMPTICLILTTSGLLLHQPLINLFVFLIGFLGFIMKKYHPLDFSISKIAGLFGYQFDLPSNPLPRRLACISGGFFNLLIAFSLIYDLTNLAIVFWVILGALQLTVIFTHFCVASWLYEMLYNYMEFGEHISLQEARRLHREGALLVDVRTPSEYQNQLISGAINIPFQMLDQHTAFHNKKIILYCNSGLRSQEATDIINKKGWATAYNLGNIKKAIRL
ncbi:DUF4395 family protein [Fulvivirga sediminis]|uniref:DUF4395 family protein n=1 Tax=Fulvivirga sediminis TaxID=2803949 RepID=A0A937JY79_9BACT|nr:DUF4395 family protein [Fulvivirga sediminis]MBL3655404.1 DUF4395 family protein [Fulvivirga sediminis]